MEKGTYLVTLIAGTTAMWFGRMLHSLNKKWVTGGVLCLDCPNSIQYLIIGSLLTRLPKLTSDII